MIISGGENIYPKEVEDILYRHPKVLEAAVYGVPDKIWGQRVHAAVVLKPGEEMTAEELFEYCQRDLASYKCPKSADFVDALLGILPEGSQIPTEKREGLAMIRPSLG